MQSAITQASHELLLLEREGLSKAIDDVYTEKASYRNALKGLELERKERLRKSECLHGYLVQLAEKQRDEAEVKVIDCVRKEGAELQRKLLSQLEAELETEKRRHEELLIEVNDEAEKRAQKRKLRRTVRGAKEDSAARVEAKTLECPLVCLELQDKEIEDDFNFLIDQKGLGSRGNKKVKKVPSEKPVLEAFYDGVNLRYDGKTFARGQVVDIDFVNATDEEEKRFTGWIYHMNPYEIWLLKREDRRTKLNVYISKLSTQKCWLRNAS